MEGASRSRNSSTSQGQGQGQGRRGQVQDIEDLKQDIPFHFEDPPAIDGDLLVLGKSECQLDNLAWDPDADADADADADGDADADADGDVNGRLEPAQPVDLDLEDNYPDENESSVLGSDYAPSGSGSGANSFYQSPTPSAAGSGCDLMLRPPSSSMYHFNYRSPGSPLPISIPGGGVGGVGGANSGRLHPYAHSPGHGAPPGFYPNMWYPNAPYGSGGSSGSGGSGGSGVGAGASGGSGREARNRAEKNRRDKLNGSIQELSTMVPHVAESPRRVDKTAVLRFAAHALRLKHAFGNSLMHQRPQITDTLMSMLDSFFLALTCHGHILLISSSIEQHLGHCQTDLYGQSIMQITHPDDQSMLKQQLIPTELENLFDAHGDPADAEGEPRQRSKSEEDYIDRRLREDRRNFRVRLARAGPRSEPIAYEVVKIDGCFRRSDEAPRGVRSNTFSSNLQLIRRTRGRDDVIPLHTISGNDIILTARARIIRPPKIASRLIDANTLEYRTRHLIDGRIIDCDQRIGIVAGYMTDEVRNLSPFTFMHNDDVRWVIVALRQMYDCNSSYGESTYRLFTRNGNIIYLQSKGYLEIDKETNKVHSFVCVNTLLSEEEGKRRVQEMKKKFSVIINTQIPQSTIDVPASEHPALLEKAVLRLIQNLQKSGEDEGDEDEEAEDEDDDEEDDEDADDGVRSMSEFGDPYAVTVSHPHHGGTRHHHHGSSALSSHGQGSSKTPPLALVPPEAASVKSSISKSISVVNVTAAKHLRGVHGSASVKSPSSVGNCSCTESHSPCDFCQGPLTPDAQAVGSTLKRSSTALAETEEKVAKRRYIPSTEIEQVLNKSLDQLGRNLTQQFNDAINLREQGQLYELPHTVQRFDEIMEEHQKQSELFVNIKSEYEVQLQNKASTRKSLESDRNQEQDQDRDRDLDRDQD
ncbi:aryl hydrocarbon receptor nuclear translocator-like protein 2 isoform X2 [Drosophila rhopaloa]|uniref:Aryl hydrocarbon receptor nuclear translocator-like protein 2 isoform X2 n=1 Tax=Drosophila rhopaloa TaxID=1041015 RepID=A0A6P4E6D0_DRORH|nr:aryl hydrocarbon receptor nuclear translocator-like protein 2 isoform X2 [Drosophila rhopaloa]